jgi:hypothetical protein
MKDILWNKIMLREFESLACLSEEETEVLHDWVHGESIVHTSMRCHMGETKVKDIRRTIREKYDAVQVYTPLLPERCK